MTTRMRPWIKWFPSDWRSDAGLRVCSLCARGLWIELLGLMHEAEPYGHLLLNGKSPTPQQIAVLVAADQKTIAKALAELENNGVFSRNDAGVIFSRRMIEDAKRAELDKANGKTGGNPNLKPKDDPSPKGGVNPPDNQEVRKVDKAKVNGEDKAHSQKPEARSQKPESVSPLSEISRAPAKVSAGGPTLNDPPSAWFAVADKIETDPDGVKRPVIGGFYADVIAGKVCELAGINGHSKPVDWSPLFGWLRDGIDPNERIFPAIKRIAARPNYSAPRFLSYFDQAVRSDAA